MARVVVATAFGGPEVLAVIDQPTLAPGPGEVVLQVRACAVNPIDYKVYSGAFGANPGLLPMRLGLEVAGLVIATGPAAIGPAGPVAAGDEVIGYRVSGGYAAELVAPAASIVPRPPRLDWAQASGLMLGGATAWHCLAATAAGGGDTVLVHGASGGVGLMVSQLAALRGALVIGTARPARHDLLREFGVIPVTYGPGLAERVRAAAPDGIDVALDLVGTQEALEVSAELVADRSRIATIAASGSAAGLGIKALGGGPGADPGTEIRAAARLELARLAGAGDLKVVVSGTFGLDEVADAHHAIMTGHTAGKLALLP